LALRKRFDEFRSQSAEQTGDKMTNYQLAPQKENQSGVSNGNVLVVEDDRDTADFYALALSQAGYGVRRAVTRQDALHLLDRNIYQIIVMDVMMTGPNLDDFMKQRAKHFPMSKLILISAYPEIEQVAKRVGIRYWVRKPFDGNALLLVVKAALESRFL
jgi:DNA-binding response OmpR family regulator